MHPHFCAASEVDVYTTGKTEKRTAEKATGKEKVLKLGGRGELLLAKLAHSVQS